jgi:hypothetical protein
VNIWYTITVEKMMQSDARKPGGFDRDILEWNIPEWVNVTFEGLLGEA